MLPNLWNIPYDITIFFSKETQPVGQDRRPLVEKTPEIPEDLAKEIEGAMETAQGADEEEAKAEIRKAHRDNPHNKFIWRRFDHATIGDY